MVGWWLGEVVEVVGLDWTALVLVVVVVVVGEQVFMFYV